jgi:hypothetical protein
VIGIGSRNGPGEAALVRAGIRVASGPRVRGVVVLIAVQVAGCLPERKTVRVSPTWNTPLSLSQVRERAARLKLPALPPRNDDEVLHYWGHAEYSETARSQPMDVSVRTAHVGDEVVVVASGSGDREVLDTLLPEGTSYEDTTRPLGAVAFDIGAEAGWTGGPGGGGWRIDAMGHLGRRFGVRSPDPGETAGRATLAVLGGAGVAMQGDRAAVRLAVTASGAVQTVARPLPGRALAGSALSLDLSAAVLTGIDEDWKAVEAGVALHIRDWGGPFVRGGREWSARGDGNTWMAGLKIGHEGIARLATAAAVCYALGYAIAKWPSADKNLP